MKKEIEIKTLVTDNLQIRVEMQEECIADYAAIYREDPKALPPVTVFYDFVTDRHYLADGFHRIAAAQRNGVETVTAEVLEGTFEDALRYALKTNATNGLRRTDADKLHALEIVWTKWNTLYKNEKRTTPNGLPSRRQLMSLCAVTDHMARTFIENLKVGESPTPARDGGSTPSASDVTTQRALDRECGRDATPTALTVTRDHLEERNRTVRDNLKQGLDRFGIAIPERIKGAFLSREPRRMVRELGKIRNALEQRRLAGDVAFAHSASFAMRDLDAAIRDLRQGMAHCVCRMCRGTGCGSCSDLGFQTRLQYERVPHEFKAAENV